MISRGGSLDPSTTAARLIDEFGTFGGAVAGGRRRQERACGEDRSAILMLREFRLCMTRALRQNIERRPIFRTSGALIDYLRADLAHMSVERVRALFLDASNRLLRDEIIADGTIDECTVYVREVLHRALDLGAAGLILVHNHPGGDASASSADISLTRRLDAAARSLGIRLHDHIIVSRTEINSMRDAALM